MELKKTNESNNTNYNEDGTANWKSACENFNVVDNGEIVGSVSINISNGSGSASINISGITTLTEGEAKVKALLGIAEE